MKRFITLLAGVVASFALLATPAGAITGNFVDDNEHPWIGLVAFYDVDPATGEETFLWRCSASALTDRVIPDRWSLHRAGRAGRCRLA